MNILVEERYRVVVGASFLEVSRPDCKVFNNQLSVNFPFTVTNKVLKVLNSKMVASQNIFIE